MAPTEPSPTSRLSQWVEGLFVAALAIGILGYAALPQAWSDFQQSRGGYKEKVFSGALPTYGHDTMTYFSWIRQARDGRFFFADLYTPESHPRNYVNVFYWSLGTLARASRLSIPDLYMVSRVLLGAALLALPAAASASGRCRRPRCLLLLPGNTQPDGCPQSL